MTQSSKLLQALVAALKCAIVIAATMLALPHAERLGFAITGDLHSGGPLIGYPVIFLLAVLLGCILFANDLRQWRLQRRQDTSTN